jgi:hypothetical protein
MKKSLWLIAFVISCTAVLSQTDSLLNANSGNREYVGYAFKSSRVINGHSIEMIAKGNLDFRILHRFGLVNTGIKNMFGLDQANMRIGLDYGLTNNLTIGIGRSNVNKELDGFLKFRVLRQSTGERGSPFTIVLAGGATLTTLPYTDPSRDNHFSSRMAFFGEVIVGRKFSNKFSFQVAPMIVHRNLVPLASDENDAFVIGLGARYKLSRRVAFVVDYQPIISGVDKDIYESPLAVGFDIETGGHVFQLHFSNSQGMNEKAFITNTTEKWGNGDIRFGFNLSRMFVLKKKKPQVAE